MADRATRSERCSAPTRRRGRCPTCRCSTPPGSGSATRRRRGAGAGARPRSPPSASRWTRSSTTSIAGDDSELRRDVDAARRRTCSDALSTRPRCRPPTRDLLAGPFAHVVVDEAQELTDAEWQMLLLRCPSRSFTDRRRPRPGAARLRRVVAGAARAGRPRPGRAGLADHQLPHAGRRSWPRPSRSSGPRSRTPTCRRRSAAAASPSRTGRSSELGVDPRQLARRARRRHRLRHRRPGVRRPPTRASGRSPRSWRRASSSTSSSLVDPESFGDGHRGRGRPLRRDDPRDPAARRPHELLTAATSSALGHQVSPSRGVGARVASGYP